MGKKADKRRFSIERLENEIVKKRLESERPLPKGRVVHLKRQLARLEGILMQRKLKEAAQ